MLQKSAAPICIIGLLLAAGPALGAGKPSSALPSVLVFGKHATILAESPETHRTWQDAWVGSERLLWDAQKQELSAEIVFTPSEYGRSQSPSGRILHFCRFSFPGISRVVRGQVFYEAKRSGLDGTQKSTIVAYEKPGFWGTVVVPAQGVHLRVSNERGVVRVAFVEEPEQG